MPAQGPGVLLGGAFFSHIVNLQVGPGLWLPSSGLRGAARRCSWGSSSRTSGDQRWAGPAAAQGALPLFCHSSVTFVRAVSSGESGHVTTVLLETGAWSAWAARETLVCPHSPSALPSEVCPQVQVVRGSEDRVWGTHSVVGLFFQDTASDISDLLIDSLP